jgi:hypothetical protein
LMDKWFLYNILNNFYEKLFTLRCHIGFSMKIG